MAYEKYKQVKTMEEYYSDWYGVNLEDLTPELKKHIYAKYVLKCFVFQRDNFTCQNEECKRTSSKLTMHHTKFKKNNGKDTLKNCVTICKTCHEGFHKGKNPLTYGGMTYTVYKPDSMNWKAVKAKSKTIRKENKRFKGFIISWEMVYMLMKFLQIPYDQLSDE